MRPGGPQGSWWMKERQRAVGLKLGCWVPAFLRALGGEATDGLESVTPPTDPLLPKSSSWSVLVKVSGFPGVVSSLHRVFPRFAPVQVVPPSSPLQEPRDPDPSASHSLRPWGP